VGDADDRVKFHMSWLLKKYWTYCRQYFETETKSVPCQRLIQFYLRCWVSHMHFEKPRRWGDVTNNVNRRAKLATNYVYFDQLPIFQNIQLCPSKGWKKLKPVNIYNTKWDTLQSLYLTRICIQLISAVDQLCLRLFVLILQCVDKCRQI
jgi:hypothetical protein